MCAAGHDDQTELMRFLIEKCRGDVNYKDQKGRTQLHAAARSGYPETVELFLRYSSDVNAQDNDGMTPLMCCAEAGREFISFDQNGRTMYGPYGKPDGHIETIRVLIRAGADVTARNKKGATAADLAAEKRFPDILAALSAGADAPLLP
jgi:ankyrin repeat protein